MKIHRGILWTQKSGLLQKNHENEVEGTLRQKDKGFQKSSAKKGAQKLFAFTLV